MGKSQGLYPSEKPLVPIDHNPSEPLPPFAAAYWCTYCRRVNACCIISTLQLMIDVFAMWPPLERPGCQGCGWQQHEHHEDCPDTSLLPSLAVPSSLRINFNASGDITSSGRLSVSMNASSGDDPGPMMPLSALSQLMPCTYCSSLVATSCTVSCGYLQSTRAAVQHIHAIVSAQTHSIVWLLPACNQHKAQHSAKCAGSSASCINKSATTPRPQNLHAAADRQFWAAHRTGQRRT